MSYLGSVLRLLAATPPRQGAVAVVDVHHEAGCSYFMVGIDWFGHETKGGAVLYVFAEGAHGLQKRVASWLAFHGLDEAPGLHFIAQAVHINTPAGLSALLAALRDLPAPPVAVFLDTVSRTLRGSDSDPEHMGAYIDAMDAIKQATGGACVIGIHHFGWQEERSRGWSGFPAAIETEITLQRDGDRLTVKNTKQKDEAKFAEIVLEAVQCRQSLVLKAIGHLDHRLSPNEKKCLEAVHAGGAEKGLSVGSLVKDHGVPRSSAHAALKRLQDLGYVKNQENRWHATEAGAERARNLSMDSQEVSKTAPSFDVQCPAGLGESPRLDMDPELDLVQS